MTVIFTSLIVNGQITKVNTINMPNTSESYSATGALSNGTKIYYIQDINNKKLVVYNAEDHTIIKDITIPISDTLSWWVSYVSDKTFDLDNKLEFLITVEGSYYSGIIIMNEDLVELFRKEQTNFYWGEGDAIGQQIQNVGDKSQMILSDGDTLYEVYELPGKVSYDLNYGSNESSVRIAQTSVESQMQLKSYPTPAKQNIKVEYNLSSQDRNALLEIIDFSGRVYYTEKLKGYTGSMNIDISSLISGTYLLRLSSAKSQRVVNKIVIE